MQSASLKYFVAATSFLFFLMVFLLPAQAQRRGNNADGNVLSGSNSGSGGLGYLPTDGWMIALNGGYEGPIGDLKEFYNGGPTFGISLMKRWNHFIFSGSVDYRMYQPKQADFFFQYELMGQVVSTGTASYSNFKGAGAYLGAAYEVLITPSASFYFGVNLGGIRSKYEFSATDGQLFDIFVNEKSDIAFFGPKLGLNLALTNRIGFGAEARYSAGLAGAQYDETGEAVTKAYKSAAANLFLSYSF